jgi:hypothetical protein
MGSNPGYPFEYFLLYLSNKETFDRYEQRKKGAEVMFFVVLLCIYFQSEIRF